MNFFKHYELTSVSKENKCYMWLLYRQQNWPESFQSCASGKPIYILGDFKINLRFENFRYANDFLPPKLCI